jgi:hypothetical protein
MKPINVAALSGPLKAITKLVEEGAHVGIGLLESLAKNGPEALEGLLPLPSLRSGASHCCSCEIPPPCWMPQPLGEITSFGKAGNKATIFLVITNCSMAVRQISIFTTSKTSNLSLSATTITLGSMERTVVEAVYTIPTSTPAIGTELLLWIRGCKLHYLRWRIKLGLISANTCYEVEVKDCPDLIHHWYDHFYCPRPCPAQGERSNVQGNPSR